MKIKSDVIFQISTLGCTGSVVLSPAPNILSHACPSYYLNSAKGEVIHNPDDRRLPGRTKYGRGGCPAPPSHLHQPWSIITRLFATELDCCHIVHVRNKLRGGIPAFDNYQQQCQLFSNFPESSSQISPEVAVPGWRVAIIL